MIKTFEQYLEEQDLQELLQNILPGISPMARGVANSTVGQVRTGPMQSGQAGQQPGQRPAPGFQPSPGQQVPGQLVPGQQPGAPDQQPISGQQAAPQSGMNPTNQPQQPAVPGQQPSGGMSNWQQFVQQKRAQVQPVPGAMPNQPVGQMPQQQ